MDVRKIKKNLTISIDQQIYNEAIKIPGLDEIIERFLKHEILLTGTHELDIVNEINQLDKEYNRIRNTIDNKMDELYRIRFNKTDYVYDESIFENSMKSLTRIHENIGHIGKDKIREFATRDKIPVDALLNYVARNTDFNIQEFTEMVK